MTSKLFPVGCMPLFGLRSPLPLEPNAATQPFLSFDPSTLRLTVNATQDAVKPSTQAATGSTPKEISRT